jgi:hypothetical protein
MAHRPILVWPSPPGIHRWGRRPGSTFRLPTWVSFLVRSDMSHLIQSNGHTCTSEDQNQPGRPSQTLILIFISHPPRERAEHSGATLSMSLLVGPLTGVRARPRVSAPDPAVAVSSGGGV